MSKINDLVRMLGTPPVLIEETLRFSHKIMNLRLLLIKKSVSYLFKFFSTIGYFLSNSFFFDLSQEIFFFNPILKLFSAYKYFNPFELFIL